MSANFRNAIVTVIAAIQHLVSQESPAPWFIETIDEDDDYEDYWTEELSIHRVELSDGRKLPVLCQSPSHAWDKIESWLLSKDDYDTSILRITRDEW